MKRIISSEIIETKSKPLSENKFLKNNKAEFIAAKPYTLKDFFLILKEYVSVQEKGVLKLCFTNVINSFPSYYDITKLKDRYVFVFEPTVFRFNTIPYCQYLGSDVDVLVCSNVGKHKSYMDQLGFKHLQLGPMDWCNSDIFTNLNISKQFDLVTVTRFEPVKRLELILNSMRLLPGVSLALVGCSTDEKYELHIKKMVKDLDLSSRVFYFNGSPELVNEILNKSKVFVFTSKNEASPKVVVESLFANTPVIITKNLQDIVGRYINKYTGMLVEERELTNVIKLVLRNYKQFESRKWAKENTGYRIATSRLNEALKALSKRWTIDIASHVRRSYFLRYTEQQRFKSAYRELELVRK